MNKNKCAIFDIDNTIFDSSWVWAALKNGCKTFSECYEKHGDLNTPIVSTLNLIKELEVNNIKIILLTARPESDRGVTISNLFNVGLNASFLKLYMVGYEDGIDERKGEILNTIKCTYDIILFMDDDKNNRIKASKLGIVAIDVLEKI